MRLLFVDPNSVSTHVSATTAHLKALAGACDVVFLHPPGFMAESLEQLRKEETGALPGGAMSEPCMEGNQRGVLGQTQVRQVRIQDVEDRCMANPGKGGIANVFATMRRLFAIRAARKRHAADAVFFATIHPVSFLAIGLTARRKDAYICFHHATGSQLDQSRLCAIAFRLFKNRVYHAYGEIFIGERLKAAGVPPSRMFWLPFPMQPLSAAAPGDPDADTIYDIVALSGSNWAENVKAIVDYEAHHGLLRKHGLRLLMKCRDFEYRSESLTVENTFYSPSDYSRLILNSRLCLSINAPAFSVQMSGQILEALSCRKPVVGLDQTGCMRDYDRRYPNVVKAVPDLDALFEQMIRPWTDALSDAVISDCFDRFAVDHSEIRIQESAAQLIAALS